MGDRISIRFVRGEDKSPYLFSHWDGMDFLARAQKYIEDLQKDTQGRGFGPLERLEPDTVIVDFIRFITKDMDRVEGNYYLCCNENDGDNSDNGHFDIDCDKIAGGINGNGKRDT